MRCAAVLWSAMLVGCATGEGSWSDLLRPEISASPSAAQSDETPSETGYALDGYIDDQTAADAAANPDAPPDALAEELGAADVEVPPDDYLPAEAPLAMAYEEPMAIDPARAAPNWTPADAVTLSWGLRLVSTVPGATPPRAILGLPDGAEEVVKAGDLLPEVGVIVLAVGDNVVQLGKVTPEGDHARVDSVFLQAMFEGRAAPQ